MISKIFVMLRSLQTSESWPSFVRSRLTPPTSTPSVVESMNVVDEKSRRYEMISRNITFWESEDFIRVGDKWVKLDTPRDNLLG